MNVLDNVELSRGLFLVALLWSSVLGLVPCQQLTAFSKVFADIGSLQVIGDPQSTGCAIECARACKQGREWQPKCDGWTFDRLQSNTPCQLYSGPINDTSSSSNGDTVYRFTFDLDIKYVTYPATPQKESLQLRDSNSLSEFPSKNG